MRAYMCRIEVTSGMLRPAYDEQIIMMMKGVLSAYTQLLRVLSGPSCLHSSSSRHTSSTPVTRAVRRCFGIKLRNLNADCMVYVTGLLARIAVAGYIARPETTILGAFAHLAGDAVVSLPRIEGKLNHLVKVVYCDGLLHDDVSFNVSPCRAQLQTDQIRVCHLV